MADLIEIDYKSYADIKDEFPYWNMNPFIDRMYSTGRQPFIFTFKATLDTLSASFAEFSKPTNVVANFTTPVQVYLVSSSAADVSKTVYVLGQKADNSIGWFTFTTDATSGDTDVDIGTWNFIAYTYTLETLAGTTKLYNGTATTYFTYTSGTTKQGKGAFWVPEGYNGGAVAQLYITPTAAVGSNAVFASFDDWIASTEDGYREAFPALNGPVAVGDQVLLKAKYETAMVASTVYGIVMFYLIP